MKLSLILTLDHPGGFHINTTLNAKSIFTWPKWGPV